MTKDDIHILYEYDRWANNRVLQAAAGLSAEEFTRDLGGSFPSVRDTLVHMSAASALANLLEGAVLRLDFPRRFVVATQRPLQSECFS